MVDVYAYWVSIAPQEIRTYLVTTVTAERRRIFQVTRQAELFEETMFGYRAQGKFLVHAYVLMPDHFHGLITPAKDVSLEKAIQLIKGGFSFRLKSKMDVWQRSFNERRIGSTEAFETAVRYVEENPVRAGLVRSVGEYPYSSAGRDGLDGMPEHWLKARG